MKKLKVLTIVFIVSVSAVFGQSNAIKLNPLALFNKRIILGYERALSDRLSVNIQGGIRIPTGLPWYTKFFDDSIANYDTRITGFNAGIDFRIYKENAIDGKYFAPYLTIEQRALSVKGNIADFDAEIYGKYRKIGVGLLFGHQYVYDSGFTLDIFGVGINKVSVSYESSDPLVDYTEVVGDLEDEIKDIPVIGNRADIKATSNSVEIGIPFFVPNLKFGLILGFAF